MKGKLKLTLDSTFQLETHVANTPRVHVDCFLVFQDDIGQFAPKGLLQDHTVELNRTIEHFDWKGKDGDLAYCEGLGVYLVGMGARSEFSHAQLMNAVASVTRAAGEKRFRSLTVFVPHELAKDPVATGKSIAIGYHLGNYSFDVYKKDPQKMHVEHLHIRVVGSAPVEIVGQIEQGAAIGEWSAAGVYLARDMVNQPASHMNPSELAQIARQIAQESQGLVSVKVLEKKDCEALGMGAFLGVAKGSSEAPKFIVLHYKPTGLKKGTPKVCFIGKSITFDTGGLSLKSASAMEDMKIDMAGGAAVLGAFQSLVMLSVESNIEVGYEVFGILAACENMPSGGAIRPGDIVTASNGQTIEVLNTDAEGRLTLADALVYAQQKIGADYIVDMATLTGACMIALGTDIAGVFGNNKSFARQIERVANEEGDQCWMLPMHKPYRANLKSNVADIANVTQDRYGGAITAAVFLNDFVSESTPWVHIDIAGPSHRSKPGRGIATVGASGWGVLSMLALLCEQQLEQ